MNPKKAFKILSFDVNAWTEKSHQKINKMKSSKILENYESEHDSLCWLIIRGL